MTTLRFLTLASCALVGFSGCRCSSPKPAEKPRLELVAPAGAPAQPPGWTPGSLTIISYNTGLAHGAVALAEQRLPAIVAALKQVDAQVLCLQEVWTDDDAEAIRSGLSERFPYSLRQVTVDPSKETSPCGIWQALSLGRCVDSQCSSKGISAEECVITRCKDRYAGLSQDCKLCLAANAAAPTGCALGGARAFNARGRNGLLLLSRAPIKRPRYTPFETLLVKRGMISAEILGFDIHCTHLSSDLKSVPYPEGQPFVGWADEQAAQVARIDPQVSEGMCALVAGDLNTAPGGQGMAAELPQNFADLERMGYSEPWEQRQCTFCKDNPLAGDVTSKQLDHIMVRGCQGRSLSYSRVLDRPLTLEVDGEPLQTRLSDHYGLRLQIKPAPTSP
jgi:endonuclease/exonuclease/phosphatase family metal-dependent hydrolase